MEKRRNLDLNYVINPSKERVTNLYNKAFSKLEEDNTKPQIEEIKPEDRTPTTPKPEIKEEKPNDKTSDKTDKYIALLKEGLINKDDFIKLVSNNNDNHSNYIQ